MSFGPSEHSTEVNVQPNHVRVSHELSVEQLQCKMPQMLRFLNEVAQKYKPQYSSFHSLPEIISLNIRGGF